MKEGTETYFKSGYLDQQVFKWIGYGGISEDKFPRFLMHFLNPLTDGGLSGNPSAFIWASAPYHSQTTEPSTGYYSWNDARFYYYKALWATDKKTQESNFAETFRAIGQVMHLVQDMSVPQHVRGDAHGLFKSYEDWAKGKITADTLKNNDYPPKYFIADAAFPLKVKNLFDTDQFRKDNADFTLTMHENIGLSEYTNANFFSPDTILATNDFPYPAWSGLSDNPQTTDLGKKKYMSKVGEGEIVNRFVRKNLFYSWLPNGSKSAGLTIDDDGIYEDYAEKLIPRAIGYSSQVLKYFFRGKMKVENMPVFDDQSNTLKELYVKVRNTTPTKETMVGNNDSSCFSLSWHYTPVAGGSDIYGRYPYCLYLDKPLPYGLDTDGNEMNDTTYTTTIIFNKLNQIQNVPAISKTDYPDVEFTITYLGTLGDEKMPPSNVSGQVTIAGAVIGKVFKPAEAILFDEKWMTAPKGDNLVWSISSDSSGNAADKTFMNNFFYCPDTEQYTLSVCPSGCPSPFTDPQGMSTDTIVTANGGNLLMTNTANVIPSCDSSVGSRPGQGNIVMIGSDIGYFNCQNQYVTSGNSYNPVDSANNFIFPIKITKNSYFQFSLDEMSISPAPPESNYALAYQILEFKFNHGYVLQFSADNQSIYNSNPYVGYFNFDLGYLMVGNIYDLFAAWGFPTPPEDFQLISIKIAQQALWNLPCNAAYTQKISVDNIRVGELKSKE